MTNYVATITVDNVIDALATFLTPYAQSSTIVRAQVNRASMPPNPCIILTEILQVDIDIPYVDFQPTNQTGTIHGPTRIDVQIDFYGANAGDVCKACIAAFRSIYAASAFADGIKPLYMSDGVQSPLITGEQQYESRWTATASLQYNPLITVPQQSATAATATIKVPADMV